MNIEIKGTSYELNLGFRFSQYLDKIYTMKQDIGNGQTIEIGVGVQMMYSYMQSYSFDAIMNFYFAGLKHHKKKPAEDDVIDAVEQLAAEKGLDGIASEAEEALRETGFYTHLFEQMDEQVAEKTTKK